LSAPAPREEPAAEAERPDPLSEPGKRSPLRHSEQSPGYRILKEGRQNHDNWLELNEYFPIHHLYTDVFRRFGLHKRFTLNDKIKIFAGLLYNLDFETPVNLIIDDFVDSAALVVSLQLMRIGQQPSLLLATNTDREGREVYAGVKNLAKTYKRSYVILDDQLIELTDLYSQSKEAELIENNRADELARFYIFDGNAANDTVAEGLLIGSIREAKTMPERSRAELTLCRYYISQNRLAEAQSLLLTVGKQLLQIDQDDRLAERYSIVYDELLITFALKRHLKKMQENRGKAL
jgi:hypothetical protein